LYTKLIEDIKPIRFNLIFCIFPIFSFSKNLKLYMPFLF